jgi:Na+(H+)/acetate symporter ActP
MFNAVFKIPMQFAIVMLGALLFVFYQFQPNSPVVFNQTQWQRQVQGPDGAKFRALEEKHAALHADKQAKITAWTAAHERGDAAAEAGALADLASAQKASLDVRNEARAALQAADPSAKKTKDSDYVFITFILTQLPHGVIGLLLAVMFASALSSKAGELNALATTSTIDLWRAYRPLAEHDEARNVRNAKWFTAFWGLFAISFALFVSFKEDLIESLNIVASIFYPALLGVFVVAFFVKWVKGSAAFWGALGAQAVVIALYFHGKIAYLWLNPIGCATCVIFAVVLQAIGVGPVSDRSTEQR